MNHPSSTPSGNAVQLYMFYLGGAAGRANIEVHDVQFVACRDVGEAIPALKATWFGDPSKLHIDGHQRLCWADGHDIVLTDQLAEQHAFGLFAADDADAAKHRARAVLLPGHGQAHKDNLKSVDDGLLLAEVGGWHVSLRPNLAGRNPPPQMQGYHPI
ncbi:DUF1543 domain-containing protein [Comamonadaceae bacterium OH2545_COT-014]|nr:DUF1543 domain-containing protein [Comamonadaceae bacterium OH2545_COT-014]